MFTIEIKAGETVNPDFFQYRRAEKRSGFRRMQVRATIRICPTIAAIAFPVELTSFRLTGAVAFKLNQAAERAD